MATTTTQSTLQSNKERHKGEVEKESSAVPLFLTVHGTPVFFREDWEAGIGGGLWSTGLVLAHYFQSDHALRNVERLAANNKRGKLDIMELGSGNGLLAVCLMALARQHLRHLVVTDLDDDHVNMIQRTVDANQHILAQQTSSGGKTVSGGDGASKEQPRVHVLKHAWGEFTAKDTDTDNNDDDVDTQQQLRHAIQTGQHQFDLIVGSDVAYRERLYNPLISSLLQYSHDRTISLIGVTMNDTSPAFFDALDRAGLRYEKLADHLLPQQFRGLTFGVFCIQK